MNPLAKEIHQKCAIHIGRSSIFLSFLSCSVSTLFSRFAFLLLRSLFTFIACPFVCNFPFIITFLSLLIFDSCLPSLLPFFHFFLSFLRSLLWLFPFLPFIVHFLSWVLSLSSSPPSFDQKGNDKEWRTESRNKYQIQNLMGKGVKPTQRWGYKTEFIKLEDERVE